MNDLKISEERKFQLKVEYNKRKRTWCWAKAKEQASKEILPKTFHKRYHQAESILNGVASTFSIKYDQNKIQLKIQQQSNLEATLFRSKRNREINQTVYQSTKESK